MNSTIDLNEERIRALEMVISAQQCAAQTAKKTNRTAPQGNVERQGGPMDMDNQIVGTNTRICPQCGKDKKVYISQDARMLCAACWKKTGKTIKEKKKKRVIAKC